MSGLSNNITETISYDFKFKYKLPKYFIVAVIIAIIIVVIAWIVIDNKKKTEKFGDPVLARKTPDILDITKQFDDLIVYENQPNGITGLDKCYSECPGYCVEYGLTGTANCFPVRKPEPKNFEGNIVLNEQKLSYPNLE